MQDLNESTLHVLSYFGKGRNAVLSFTTNGRVCPTAAFRHEFWYECHSVATSFPTMPSFQEHCATLTRLMVHEAELRSQMMAVRAEIHAQKVVMQKAAKDKALKAAASDSDSDTTISGPATPSATDMSPVVCADPDPEQAVHAANLKGPEDQQPAGASDLSPQQPALVCPGAVDGEGRGKGRGRGRGRPAGGRRAQPYVCGLTPPPRSVKCRQCWRQENGLPGGEAHAYDRTCSREPRR